MFYLFSLSCCFKSNFQTVGLIFVQSPGSPRSGLGTTPLLTAVQACHLEAGASGDQWFDGHKNGEYKLEYYIYIILYILCFIIWYMFRLFSDIYLYIYIHICVLYIYNTYIYIYVYIYICMYIYIYWFMLWIDILWFCHQVSREPHAPASGGADAFGSEGSERFGSTDGYLGSVMLFLHPPKMVQSGAAKRWLYKYC